MGYPSLISTSARLLPPESLRVNMLPSHPHIFSPVVWKIWKEGNPQTSIQGFFVRSNLSNIYPTLSALVPTFFANVFFVVWFLTADRFHGLDPAPRLSSGSFSRSGCRSEFWSGSPAAKKTSELNEKRIRWSRWVTLPETNSLPLKIGHPKRKLAFQPSIFRGYVSFRECKVFRPCKMTNQFRFFRDV